MPEISLDKIIAQKLGELTILNARQAVLIEALRIEVAKRDAELEKYKTVSNTGLHDIEDDHIAGGPH